MRDTERNPHSGLTNAQLAVLREAENNPQRQNMGPVQMYRDISLEYAVRAARMLTANDLRGALSAAELSAACEAMSERHEYRRLNAALTYSERLAEQRESTAGMLVRRKGKSRALRVLPDDPWPPDAYSGDPRA